MSVQSTAVEATTTATATAVKVTPPLAVTGMQILGYGLSDWVLLLTLIYTAIQLGFLLFDRFKKHSVARKKK